MTSDFMVGDIVKVYRDKRHGYTSINADTEIEITEYNPNSTTFKGKILGSGYYAGTVLSFKIANFFLHVRKPMNDIKTEDCRIIVEKGNVNKIIETCNVNNVDERTGSYLAKNPTKTYIVFKPDHAAYYTMPPVEKKSF